ncbi:MAG TPA: FHA domain-containing protein [Pseudolysinimonas sp.]|nr:FHA domain-containing protein [Pseudolysinimonas sp.]
MTGTDDLEHTLGVERPVPPALVEPPEPERGRLPEAALPGVAATEPEGEAAPSPAPEPARREAPAVTADPPARRPYRLRMADGVVVNLDLTVYLGRRPSVPRVASDRRVRLVTVPSRGKEVSATHLELRWTGDAVVATDMRSTNGSRVMIPGNQPRTLLRGESAVVTPGTLIDLGDGNVLEVLSPERLTVDA